jgi:exopolyphosphatase/pppGpp-phosphohydrolase
MGAPEHLADAQAITDRTTTLVKNDTGLLPLTDGPRNVLVAGWGVGTTQSMAAALRDHGATTQVLQSGTTPSTAEIDAAVADIDAHLDACPVDPALAQTVVGVAGTIITVAAGVLGLISYDRDAIDQAVLDRDDVHVFAQRLLAMTVEERIALPFMHPGRADVIGAGALILDRVLRRTSATSLVVSEADILDGIAWSMFRG